MDFLSIVAIGLPLTASAVGLVMAALVYWGAAERRVARAFVQMATNIALWNLFVGLQAIPGMVDHHPLLINVLRCTLLILPAVCLHASAVWADRDGPVLRVLIPAGYVISALLIAAQTQGLLWDGWLTYSWGVVGRAGRLYPLFVAYSVAWLGSMVWLVGVGMRRAPEAHARLRLRYFYFAALVGAPLGLTNFLPVFGVRVPPLGGLGCICLLSVLAYGSLRHRMLEVDVLLMKLATPVLAALATLPFALVLLWMHQQPALDGTGAAAVFLLLSLLGMSLYARIRAQLDAAIERSLFPARHRARQAIEKFSRESVELAQRQDLAPQLTATLTEGLGLSGAALYVRDDGGFFRCEAAAGDIAAPTPLLDASTAEAHQWELCLPIGANGLAFGFIALGAKRSGAAIDDLDMTLLAAVASQVAVALKNIEHVKQIERQKAEIEELQKRLQAENTALRAEVRSVSGFGDIVGQSPALQRVLELIEKTARSDASILVTGETGTGKELIARAVHELSARRGGPLISVNCPAIPHDLAEAELFGCERGAFTGATESRPGRFELADRGTVFLDEVADLPMAVQTKLLRVLQEHEVQRLGSRHTRKVDVRVVAASNRDLRQAIARGHFRADLYHRLAGIVAELPPLRERAGDIEMLATYFLDRAAKTHRKPITAFSEEAMQALRGYSWPGNIRELQNVVDRAVLLCEGEMVSALHLGDLAIPEAGRSRLATSLREEKLRRVQEALAEAGGNQSEAARRLGITRSNLARMMKSLGLRGPGTLQ